uniref:Fibronectin type-III domain-containing protein n=1 Tax=Echinococcus granulosus TaxID=6210 RepID=A0A068X510_ECHGR|nr:hypothetical protein EgrG_002053200 [Echinococcus granulosus]
MMQVAEVFKYLQCYTRLLTTALCLCRLAQAFSPHRAHHTVRQRRNHYGVLGGENCGQYINRCSFFHCLFAPSLSADAFFKWAHTECAQEAVPETVTIVAPQHHLNSVTRVRVRMRKLPTPSTLNVSDDTTYVGFSVGSALVQCCSSLLSEVVRDPLEMATKAKVILRWENPEDESFTKAVYSSPIRRSGQNEDAKLVVGGSSSRNSTEALQPSILHSFDNQYISITAVGRRERGWIVQAIQMLQEKLEVNTFHTAILHSHVPAHLPMTWLDKRLCQLLFQQPSPASFLNALAAIQYQKAQIDSCQSLLSTLAQNRQHISMHFRLL